MHPARRTLARRTGTRGQRAIDFELRRRVQVLHYAERVQQVPRDGDDTDFWVMWTGILRERGLKGGDYLDRIQVLRRELARHSGARFIPYDFERTVFTCDATSVRDDPLGQFEYMLDTFSRLLTRRITFFGADRRARPHCQLPSLPP